MIRTAIITACGAVLLTLGMAANDPATALTQKECGVKYQAAKTAGTLNGMKYADFRKKECGAGATPAAATNATPAATPTAAKKETPTAAKKETPTAAKKETGTAANPSAAVFPTAISPKYANEKPGRARLKTCSDQYQANKTTNGNGGLKWIQKGGGYWSECNKHLKG